MPAHPAELGAMKDYVSEWGVRSAIETLAELITKEDFRSPDDDAESSKTDRQLAAGLRNITNTHDMSWY